MQAVELSFPIEVISKKRPRLGRNGSVYTPKDTKRFERTLTMLAKSRFRGPLLEGAVKIEIVITRKKPKTSKNKHPIVKPDLDNLVKSILDSANEWLFTDDAQVCICNASKQYGESANLLIRAEEME